MRVTIKTKDILKTIPKGTPCILKTDSGMIKEGVYSGDMHFRNSGNNFNWSLTCDDWEYLDIADIKDKDINIAIGATVYYSEEEYNYLSKINEKYSLLVKDDVPIVVINNFIREIETLTIKL